MDLVGLPQTTRRGRFVERTPEGYKELERELFQPGNRFVVDGEEVFALKRYTPVVEFMGWYEHDGETRIFRNSHYNSEEGDFEISQPLVPTIASPQFRCFEYYYEKLENRELQYDDDLRPLTVKSDFAKVLVAECCIDLDPKVAPFFDQFWEQQPKPPATKRSGATCGSAQPITGPTRRRQPTSTQPTAAASPPARSQPASLQAPSISRTCIEHRE